MSRRKYLRIVLIDKLIFQTQLVSQYLDQAKVLTIRMLPIRMDRIASAQLSFEYTRRMLRAQKRRGKKFVIINDTVKISNSNWNTIKW